jgi:hypothetical protein
MNLPVEFFGITAVLSSTGCCTRGQSGVCCPSAPRTLIFVPAMDGDCFEAMSKPLTVSYYAAILLY